MIHVVIVEDHALFRSGLKQILSLQKDLLVEGEAVHRRRDRLSAA